MAKRAPRKPKVTLAEVQEIVASQSAQVQENDSSPEITFETKELDPEQGSEEFNPKLNLRVVTAGVWRYICKDIKNVKDEVFESELAQAYGIRKNDMIFLVANKKHKIVVV